MSPGMSSVPPSNRKFGAYGVTIGCPPGSWEATTATVAIAIVVDTCGLLLVVLVTGAHVQDRDAARLLLWALRTCFPTVRLLWADGGYSGQLVDWAATILTLAVEIVRKLAGQV